MAPLDYVQFDAEKRHAPEKSVPEIDEFAPEELEQGPAADVQMLAPRKGRPIPCLDAVFSQYSG
jgi:hypothetical protein